MYTIVTTCIGAKYEKIREHWVKRVEEKCKNATIKIIDCSEVNIPGLTGAYAWWDIVRMKEIIELLSRTRRAVVHCDIDIIVEKDIEELLEFEGDFIISTEIGGANSFPRECSSMLGFGVCSGFYICKPSSLEFLKELYSNMIGSVYNSYSDQVTIMNMITNSTHEVVSNTIVLDSSRYTNKMISFKNIKMCVLDFNIVIRDPEYSNGQFANHINIDNVGGSDNFIKYFYEPFESLPLTCRCGKLGDTNICSHRK